MTQAIRPAFINCARCGAEKRVGRGGPIPTYCSASCRNALSKERSRSDGRYEQRLEKSRTQAAARREANARPCPYCDSPMTNPRRVQCGAPECKRQFQNARQAEFQRQHKAKHGVYYSRQYDGGRVKAYPITCAQCGREATVTKTTSKYCSHQCFYDAKYGDDRPHEDSQGVAAHKRLSPRRRRAIRTLRLAARGTAGIIPWIAGCCTRCGESFVRRQARMIRHCSRRCQIRDKAAKRRALQAGAAVDAISRYRIHVRDGWTCHICGDPVDRNAVVPELEAPVLDHVIALAKGGSHSEDNLRTAHFYCNSVKRDLEVGWSAA